MKEYRPKFHIAPMKGWINDPNGFGYGFGKYHVYAQHNPNGLEWGPMHWLHFESEDLVKWVEKGVALYPKEKYELPFGCFSGGAVPYKKGILYFYTGACEGYQCQNACFYDGKKYRKLGKNPLIGRKELPKEYSDVDFRDPKPFYKDGKLYVLVGAKRVDGGSAIILFVEENDLDFRFVGEVLYSPQKEGMMECCDILFFGDKCVLMYSPQFRKGFVLDRHQNIHSSLYHVGKLDLSTGHFEDLTGEIELDKGFDFYATQTFEKDGRYYLIAWEAMWDRNYPSKKEGYAGNMTMIRELSLIDNRLHQKFVGSLSNYESTPDDVAEIILGHKRVIAPDAFRLKFETNLADSKEIVLLEKGGKGIHLIPLKGYGFQIVRDGMDEEIVNAFNQIEDVRYLRTYGDEVALDCVVDGSCIDIIANGERSISLTYFAYGDRYPFSFKGNIKNVSYSILEMKGETK